MKALREFEEKKLRVSAEYYANRIYQLQIRKAESRESIRVQVEIMAIGWKAFEDEDSLVANPYRLIILTRVISGKRDGRWLRLIKRCND